MTKPLTAKQVEHIPVEEKRKYHPVGPMGGLYLLVHPTGNKSWCYAYRSPQGANAMLTLGQYPKMSLAAARAEANQAREAVRDGSDPALQRSEEQQRPPESVARVVEEYIERQCKPNQKTWRQTETRLQRELVNPLGKRMIESIKPPDLHRIFDGIIERGAKVEANRVYANFKTFFDWAKKRGYIPASPMADFDKPLRKELSRDRVLGDDELRVIVMAISTMGYPYEPFFKLLLLSAQRENEVAQMRWEDVDLDKTLWVIPAGKTKPGRVQDVPLSKAALEILSNLPRFTGPHLFTSVDGQKPLHGFSKVKVRIDKIIREQQGKEIAPWRFHDFRRTATTFFQSIGTPWEVCQAVLNHAPQSRQSGITMVYARHRYEAERRAALDRWAQHVLALAKAKEALGRKLERAG